MNQASSWYSYTKYKEAIARGWVKVPTAAGRAMMARSRSMRFWSTSCITTYANAVFVVLAAYITVSVRSGALLSTERRP